MGAIDRRTFMAGAVGTAVLAGMVEPAGAERGAPPITEYPFTLGVASGDPLDDGFVIWTRLAPQPTVDGGGMAPKTYWVQWQVATDEAMSNVVKQGWAPARRGRAHAVHVDVRWLDPGREYWYRFKVEDHLSPIGRSRTTPARNDRPAELTLALVSCQRYTSGYYLAYDDIVAHDPDMVVHVGDYLYETGGNSARHDPLPESITLDQYRNRYGLYKSDTSLQAAHAMAPWLFTADDHEVENNYANLVPEVGSATPDAADFLARRIAAYRAYWEHMPFRRRPRRENFRIYRKTSWGKLADLFVLDTRQYRSDQCGEIGPACDPNDDASRTMLGDAQQRWLDRGLKRSRADWAVLAQQVVFSKMDFIPGEPAVFNLDQWDGYPTAREQVLASMRKHRPNDNIVLTGDIHASFVSDVMADYDDADSSPMGAEFVGTSVTSGGNGSLQQVMPFLLEANPHVKWGETRQRGWVKHTVTSEAWRADYRHYDSVRELGNTPSTVSSWVVPRGGGVEQV